MHGTPTRATPSAGATHAAAIVAGSMLGVGIFIGPPQVAARVSSLEWFVALWVLGGLSALCGAAAVAELGAMMPRSGGDYVYLREAYGDAVAFAVGWLQILAIFPGSIAALAAALVEFQLPVLFGPAAAQPLAVLGVSVPATAVWGSALILGFTALNHCGIVPSGRVQVALVAVPVAVFAVVALAVLFAARGGGEAANAPRGSVDAAALAAAYLPVYYAYSGWNAAIYVAGEIHAPERNLPRALLGATLAVMVLYLLLVAGLVVLFPLAELATVGEAGTAAAYKLFGAAGVAPVTVLIALAVLASINGTVLGGARIACAMAEHRHFFSLAGRTDRVTGAPLRSLWLQAAWAIVLLATQSFSRLLAYTTSAMLITGVLTVLAVVVLRIRRPAQRRPYRAVLYPWTPLVFSALSLLSLATLAAGGDPSALMAIGWFAAALLVHAVRRRVACAPPPRYS